MDSKAHSGCCALNTDIFYFLVLWGFGVLVSLNFKMILYQLIKHCMAFYYDHINISIIYLACWGLETRYKDNIRRGMGSLYFLPKWWHYTVRSTCFLPLSFLFYALFIIIKGGVCLTALEVNWFIQIFYINYFLAPFSPLMGKTKINGIVWILLQRISFIISLYLILVGNTYISLLWCNSSIWFTCWYLF